jgi:hypothetical protein
MEVFTHPGERDQIYLHTVYQRRGTGMHHLLIILHKCVLNTIQQISRTVNNLLHGRASSPVRVGRLCRLAPFLDAVARRRGGARLAASAATASFLIRPSLWYVVGRVRTVTHGFKTVTLMPYARNIQPLHYARRT